MKSSAIAKEIIRNGEFNERLLDIYVDESLIEHQKARYIYAIEKYEELYGAGDIMICSAPGRSEIGGNHTDHQRGQVLACGHNHCLYTARCTDLFPKVLKACRILSFLLQM